MKLIILILFFTYSLPLLAATDFEELKNKFETKAVNISIRSITNDDYSCEEVGINFERDIDRLLRIKKLATNSSQVILALGGHRIDQIVLEQADAKTFSSIQSEITLELRKIRRGEIILRLTENGEVTFFDCEFDDDWWD